MLTHAKYSPSKLPRIIRCPGSVQMTEDQVQETSSFAEEGTMLHKVVEESLDLGELTVSNDTITKYSLTPEHIDAVQECLDYVFLLQSTCDDPDAYFQTESKVTLASFVEPTKCNYLADVYGQLDFSFVCPNLRELYIVDWKFGAGIEVFPDSDQLKAYAVGKLGSFKPRGQFDLVHLVIGQPRIYSGDHIKVNTVTPADLTDWLLNILVPALNKVDTKRPVLSPSDEACRWCAAKQTCPARKKAAQQAAQDVFKIYADLPKVDVNEVIRLLKVLPDLKSYISDIELWAFKHIQAGRELPGFKLVEGRSIRKWADEKVAKKVLSAILEEDKLYTKKFVSPTQAEKVVDRKFKTSEEFTKLIIKPKGKPTLVPASDKRAPLNFETAEDKFAKYVV